MTTDQTDTDREAANKKNGMTGERASSGEQGAKKNCIYSRSDNRGSMYEPHVGLYLRPSARETLRELQKDHTGWLILILISAGVGFGVVVCLTLFWPY